MKHWLLTLLLAHSVAAAPAAAAAAAAAAATAGIHTRDRPQDNVVCMQLLPELEPNHSSSSATTRCTHPFQRPCTHQPQLQCVCKRHSHWVGQLQEPYGQAPQL
jgi:hypothetical protein